VKAVLDTNVLVSACISLTGACHQIVVNMYEGRFTACIHRAIEAEYEDVLNRPDLGIDESERVPILNFMRVGCEHVWPSPLQVVLPDEADRIFLEVAHAASAVLVTGNLRHFPKRMCKGVTVATPREFLEILRQSS